MNDVELWRELGQQLRVDSIRPRREGGIGPSDLRDVRGRPDGRAAREVPALRLRQPARPAQRPARLLEGPRLDARSTRCSAPPARSRTRSCSRTASSASIFEGHPTPRIPWVDVATGSLGQGLPYGGRHGARRQAARPAARSASGCSAATARSPRARSGRRSSTRRSTSSTTSSRSSTSTGSASAARRCTAGTSTPTPTGRGPSAATRSRSTATTSRRSTARTPRRSTSTGQPIVIVAQDDQGQGRRRRSRTRTAGTASRSTTPTRRSPSSAASAHLASRWRSRSRAPRARVPDRAARAAALRARRGGRDAEGVRRRARGARQGARRRRRARRRGLELDLRRGVRARRIPDRYFEMYIAEQQMVATAVGMQVLGWRPFASTFAAFLSRAYDFVRMSAISRASYCLSGSHAGVSIGEDGPSQMALEDIAVAPRGPRLDGAPSVRREPDREARRADGGHRGDRLPPHAAPERRRCIYGPDEEFEIGGSRIAARGRRRDARRRRDHRARGAGGGRRRSRRTGSRRG